MKVALEEDVINVTMCRHFILTNDFFFITFCLKSIKRSFLYLYVLKEHGRELQIAVRKVN